MNISIRKYLKFSQIFFLFVSSINCENLLIDMGGVLLRTSKFKALAKLGMETLGHLDLKERFFEFLNFIDDEKNPDSLVTFKGVKLPSFLCKWQKGELDCKTITDLIVNQVQTNPKGFKFKNDTEKRLIKKSAELFLPANNVTITKPIKDVVRILKECKNKKDKNGNLVNTLYLASNCDEETFNEFKNAFPDIFGPELFDEDKIFISGKMKKIKPYSDFYMHIIDEKKLDPKSCIMLDDQKENIEGAKKCGIDGILFKNIGTLRKDLKKRKLI